MDIHIKIVDRKDMRPGLTKADWFFDENGDCQVRIEHLSDWKREVALGLHEMFEALLCKYHGVSVESVDAFDAPFEAAHDDVTNVGDKTDAPYRRQHGFSTAVERIWTSETDVPWQDYDDEIAETGRWKK